VILNVNMIIIAIHAVVVIFLRVDSLVAPVDFDYAFSFLEIDISFLEIDISFLEIAALTFLGGNTDEDCC